MRERNNTLQPTREGLVLINKPKNVTSFHLVAVLRRLLGVRKIGHAGTLDPFATGVMVMLVGRKYTRLSDQFLTSDKEYVAELQLGARTNTFDVDGEIQETSDYIPTQDEVEEALQAFQGKVEQIPPMFSAKKVGGKKLCDLARKGIEVERSPCTVELKTELLSYNYPNLKLRIACSKGTYIRSVADDLGRKLNCFAHLRDLTRTRSGHFRLDECVDLETIKETPSSIELKPWAPSPA